MLDSDGTIGIQAANSINRSGQRRARYIEYASLGQVDPEAVQFFGQTFGGTHFIRPPADPRELPLFCWRITHRPAATLLTAALPHLRIKRRQAELCVELRRVKDATKQRGHNDVELARIRAEVLELNQVEGRADRRARNAASNAARASAPSATPVEDMPAPAICAYAAGVIDSDGSIRIHRDSYALRVLHNTSEATFSECVTIRQLESEAVDVIHAQFGGSRGVVVPKDGDHARQPLQVLQLVDRRAVGLITAALPHLRIKRPQAELCLELRRLKDESRKVRFAVGRGHRGAGRRPNWITAAMEDVQARMLELNRRDGHVERRDGEGDGIADRTGSVAEFREPPTDR